MVWLWFALIVLAGFVFGGCATVAITMKLASTQATDATLPERTVNMCEYGTCREKWTTFLNLGLDGFRYVCDEHEEAIRRERAPGFEAMGVRE
jgi:hypothetical protein